MNEIIKMTDISILQAKQILASVRYVSVLNPMLYESEEGIILNCNVDDSNRRVYADLLTSFSRYIYSDNEQNAFQRFTELIEVRNLRVAIFEQGTRAKIVSNLLNANINFDNSLIYSCFFNNIGNLLNFYSVDNINDFFNFIQLNFNVDIILLTFIDANDNVLEQTNGFVFLRALDNTFNTSYKFLGNKTEISEQFSFLSTCFAIKKIF